MATETGAETILRIDDLSVVFDTERGVVRAVNSVSLATQRGRCIGLVGESGCGKSVTGLSILGLIRPPGRITGGRILYTPPDGSAPIDLVQQSPTGETMRSIRGDDIAMIFQEPMSSLNPVYTIGDQIGEAVQLHRGLGKAAARAAATAMLASVGLPRPDAMVDAYPHQLSGGMRQRAMIAMALSCDPRLLIADEPTTALDVTVQAQILDLISAARAERDMAVLLITHDLGIVAHLADEIIVMYLGTVVESGPSGAVFDGAKHPYTRALLRSVPVLGARAKDRLAPIEGTVPDALRMPEGCPFQPRCPEALKACDVRPRETTIGEGHTVACWLYE